MRSQLERAVVKAMVLPKRNSTRSRDRKFSLIKNAPVAPKYVSSSLFSLASPVVLCSPAGTIYNYSLQFVFLTPHISFSSRIHGFFGEFTAGFGQQ